MSTAGDGSVATPPPSYEPTALSLRLLRLLEVENGMDPILLLALRVGVPELCADSTLGDYLWNIVHPVLLEEGGFSELLYPGENVQETVWAAQEKRLGEILDDYEKLFDMVRYGKKARGLRWVKSPVRAQHWQKKQAIEDFVKECDTRKIPYAFASIVQTVRHPKGRQHVIMSHPENFIIQCAERIVGGQWRGGSPPDPNLLGLVEMPNALQEMQMFYLDWDMYMINIAGVLRDELGILDEEEQVAWVRNLAFQVPAWLGATFVRLGILDATSRLLVSVTENTRWHKGKGCFKVGIHFILRLAVTRRQFKAVWRKLVNDMESTSAGVLSVMQGKAGITGELLREAGGNFCMVGADLHPFNSRDQMLYFPFGGKQIEDPRCWPVCIVHVVGGTAVQREALCKEVWQPDFKVLRNKRRQDCRYPVPPLWYQSIPK